MALIQKSSVEECKELATPVGSDMLSFDGFVKLVRYGHPEMALSTIMRLWCIVDKTGQGGGVGFANIPDLVTNILAATMSLDDEKCEVNKFFANAKLKGALGRKKAYNAAQAWGLWHKHGKPMSECMGLVLKALMDDPKYQCTSASQAWAFFMPGSSKEVTRSRFRDKLFELGVLTSSEIVDTVDFLDSGCSGSVNYDEWKAGVMLALAANGDLHALLTEEEFNAIMFRIKTKIDAKGKTIEETFQALDLDGNASLSTEEFAQGIIEFGVSQKEAKQIFSVIDADKSGTLEFNEFIDAIREGAEADVMKQVVQPILRQVGTALIKKSSVEVGFWRRELEELATPVGSDMLSFDGFVKL